MFARDETKETHRHRMKHTIDNVKDFGKVCAVEYTKRRKSCMRDFLKHMEVRTTFMQTKKV